MKRAWAKFQRWFNWIALAATAIGVVLAVRSQWDAILGLEWGRSWQVIVIGAVAFAVPPLVQAFAFWVSLRLLGVRAPLAETLVVWGRSFVVSYAPTGALSVVYGVRAKDRLGATSQQVPAASARARERRRRRCSEAGSGNGLSPRGVGSRSVSRSRKGA